MVESDDESSMNFKACIADAGLFSPSSIRRQHYGTSWFPQAKHPWRLNANEYGTEICPVEKIKQFGIIRQVNACLVVSFSG